ncbi:MAG: NusG domain II-containing protein [Bacillota bacterium]|nr:NusG domain II-containing protein [Bacillota bacterium]MDW7684717.1 NusG domain II-containing protein [Bacillota bacterium]
MNWKKGDLVVVAVILVIALGFLGVKALPAASGSRLLQVELDGKTIDEIPFDMGSTETITVSLPEGEALVEIDSGRVRVLPMPKHICPLGICSSVGWVDQAGDAIVCLPNRLVLTVVGGETNEVWDSLDGVTK